MDEKKKGETDNNMQRRSFVKAITTGSLGAAIMGTPIAAAASSSNFQAEKATPQNKKVLMKVGCQSGGTTKENLEFKARHGVFNIDGGAPKYIKGKGWDLDESMKKREACEKYGISLDAYHLTLTSAGIDKVETPNIMLGKSPERDREIEDIQQMISVAGKTGVHCLNYNTIILPILRTGMTPDPKRGNASYTTWDYKEAIKKKEPLTIAGVVNIDQMYERITYLLDRILPVAEEYKVRDSLDARLEDIKINSEKANIELPSLFLSLLPVLIPLVFICADTFINLSATPGSAATTASAPNGFVQFVHFLGDKNIALITGGLVALILLAARKKGTKFDMTNFVQAALMSGGGIILITAAGGAFGGMLQQTGISSKIAEMTKHYQMALIPLAFVIAAVVRTAQGSATVALITASGILSGMANSGHLEYHHLYIGLAIGCGAKVMPWMNDAGFWIVCKMSNLTEREAMKTFAPMGVVMGFTGLVIILIAAKLFPLL